MGQGGLLREKRTKKLETLILATKNTTPIIGPISTILGYIMDGIFRMLNAVGIQNLGLCIIIFSIIVYLLMTPLQIRQQKFSKMSAVMNPELQRVQKKYAGKKDQASMQRMQEETQAVYAKYGVSPTGSCLQLFIQLPILWALWQVIYKIPAYVGSVREVFTAVVDKIVAVPEYTTILNNFITDNTMTRVRLVMENEVATKDSVIDFLYALSPNQWKIFSALPEVSEFSGTIDTAAANISKMQNFFGLNIAEQPLYYIKNVVTGGSIVLCIVAILIPVLSWFTQMLNIKLMPQMSSDDDKSAANSSMKTMNTFMPLMSAFFCLSFPVGLGIYWIASAVVRSIQQVVINKKLDSEDINDIIEANLKKAEKKREKAGLPPQKITNQAHQSVKHLESDSASKQEKVNQAYENARKASPGSIAAKANMVRDYNERNKK